MRVTPCRPFRRANVGPTGSSQVSVPADGGGNGTPAVLLFFGAWCPSCKAELPPLAAAVKKQDRAHGALARIHVIGVDSFDKTSIAKSFIHTEGVTFPVASDPGAGITSGLFYFRRRPLRGVRQRGRHDRQDRAGRRAHALVLHG